YEMNILVTGANGLLGRYLVELLSNYHKVFAIVKDKENLNFELNDNISVIEIDLSLVDTELFPKNIDVVYYLAQSNRFREFPEGVDDMLSVNVVAPNILAKWAVRSGVKKFIYASSGGVYTNPNKPVKEFFDINANEKLGFYLNSKLSAEMLLKNYVSLFETFAIIRPFFMYGVGQNENMLIPRLISSMQNEKEITLNGVNGIKINPIYVTDASEAVANILDLTGEYIINIAGNEVVSLRELCVKIGELVDKKPVFKINDVSQNDLVADIEMMKKELIIPSISLVNGLERLIKYE
ncbi:MAG: NAD(P)-dependent oxidoreductase, partial [Campylobacterales bacterium]|nr:NAD(P)-dependent oxidoreductase [Campylobacterales bacterium]